MMLAIHTVLLVGVVGLAACKSIPPSASSAPRYIVTAAPLVLIGPGHPGICVAVDPRDTQGVWWWDAGWTGCTTRSSSVIQNDASRSVTRTRTGTVEVSFGVGLINGPNSTRPNRVDVRIVLQNDTMRVVASGASVATVRRHDLLLPESGPFR